MAIYPLEDYFPLPDEVKRRYFNSFKIQKSSDDGIRIEWKVISPRGTIIHTETEPIALDYDGGDTFINIFVQTIQGPPFRRIGLGELTGLRRKVSNNIGFIIYHFSNIVEGLNSDIIDDYTGYADLVMWHSHIITPGQRRKLISICRSNLNRSSDKWKQEVMQHVVDRLEDETIWWEEISQGRNISSYIQKLVYAVCNSTNPNQIGHVVGEILEKAKKEDWPYICYHLMDALDKKCGNFGVIEYMMNYCQRSFEFGV